MRSVHGHQKPNQITQRTQQKHRRHGRAKENSSRNYPQQMQSRTLQVPGFLVRCCGRLSLKLSIEEARSLDAVKLEEAVDKDKVKALYNNGQFIAGVSKIHYIQISEKP